MFAQATDGAPPGEVWSTYVAMEQMVWYYLLSIDVKVPWSISEIDLVPPMAAVASGIANAVNAADGGGNGWVAHQWFSGHIPTPCQHGSHAIASGCIVASVRHAHPLCETSAIAAACSIFSATGLNFLLLTISRRCDYAL